MLRASIFLCVLAAASGQANTGECVASSDGRSTCPGSDQTTLLQSRVHLALEAEPGSDAQPQYNSGTPPMSTTLLQDFKSLAQGAIERGTPATYRAGLFRENVYYFRQGRRCKNLNGRKAAHAGWKKVVNYRNTGRKWKGFRTKDNFAVRWTGKLRIFRSGRYHFQLISDDGSKLWIDKRYTINNDGAHGWRSRVSRRNIRGGWRLVRIEFFERGGHAGMLFRYHGPDTGNRWAVARAGGKQKKWPKKWSKKEKGKKYCVANINRKTVTGPFATIATARKKLNKRRGSRRNRQMICEMSAKGAKRLVAQDGGPRAGFNKYWSGWGDIHRMEKMCADSKACTKRSSTPTAAPTAAPTPAPTAAPTAAPTPAPTPAPTAAPTPAPTTMAPTAAPTAAPTPAPSTMAPTAAPKAQPKKATCVETLTGNGKDYRGCQDKTRGGKTCQKWSTQSPHRHGVTPAKYPKILGDNNFCRNADGEASIWCYTMDPKKRWDYCDPKATGPAATKPKKTSAPCGFETSAQPYCKTWRNVRGDQFDWTRKSGSTPTSRTGPSKAHSGNHYMYIESSWRKGHDKAVLQSSTTTFGGGAWLSFQHHLFGPRIGTLKVLFKEDRPSAQPVILWQRNGGRGNKWHLADIDLSRLAGKTGVIQIMGIITHKCARFLGDMAIDEISLTPGSGSGAPTTPAPTPTSAPPTLPPTMAPTAPPTSQPTMAPTMPPTTMPPTSPPALPVTTVAPTAPPTMAPTTMAPAAPPTRSPSSNQSMPAAVKSLTKQFDRMDSKMDGILKKVR